MSDELKTLARAYADGQITQSQLHQLETMLQSEANARQRYLEEMSLINSLEDHALSMSSPEIGTGQAAQGFAPWSSIRSFWPRWSVVAALSASLLFLASSLWLVMGGRSMGHVASSSGAIRWIGSDGTILEDVATGTHLGSGTFELLSPGSYISFQYDDGSIITLSGESELTLSRTPRKELYLRHGHLSADVRPQPSDSPMIVRTQLAELQVIGTQFNVMAQDAETALVVNEGLVRMVRSSDGQETDVPARHVAVASLDAKGDLQAARQMPDTLQWKADLTSDSCVLHGIWTSTESQLADSLKQAVASGKMTEAEALATYRESLTLTGRGSVWAQPSKHGCFLWLDVGQDDVTSVRITDRTRLRVAGRLFGDAGIEIGFSTYAIEGGFEGKQSQSLSIRELGLDSAGRFEVVFTVSEFFSNDGDAAIGSRIHDWWCASKSHDAKFEITDVEIFEE